MDKYSTENDHQLVKALRAINQCKASEKTLSDFLYKFCDVLKENLAIQTSWIILFSENKGYSVFLTQNSPEDKYQEAEIRNKIPDCVLTALENGVSVSQQVNGQCSCCPIQQKYKDCLNISASLKYKDTIYGIISLITLPGNLKENSVIIRDIADELSYIVHNYQLSAKLMAAESELKNKQSMYRDLFSSIDNAVAVYLPTADGNDFIITDFNPAAEKLEHVRKESITGKKVTEVFPGVKDFGLFDVLQKVNESGIPVNYPLSFYKDDRITGWRENEVYKLPTGEIVAIYKDVTENKQTEEKLTESEERYRRITANITDYLYTVKVEKGKAVETIHNETSVAVTGYSPAEFYADPYLWINMVVPEEREAVAGRLQNFLAGENVPVIEHRIIRKDGTIRWVSDTIIPKYNATGQLTSYEGVIRDITERKLAENTIHESEQLFEQLFDTNPDPIAIIIVENGICLNVNLSFCELTGWSKEESIGKTATDLNLWLDQEKRKELINGIKKDGSVKSLEAQFRAKDGRIFTALMSAKIIFVQGVACILTVTRNISDRIEATNALRFSEQKFRSSTEDSPLAIYTTDKNGDCVFANKKWLDIAGLTKEEAQGNGWVKAIHPDDLEFVKTNWYKSVESRGQWGYEYRFRSPAGKTTWVWGTAIALLDDNGEITAYLGSNIDITERKKAEKKIKFQSLLIDSVGEGVIATDNSGNIIYWNKGAETIYGWEKEEVLGKNIISVITPDDKIKEAVKVIESVNGKKIWSGEFWVKNKSGERFPIALTDSPIFNEHDQIIGIIGTSRDISELVRTNEELIQSEQKYRLLHENAGIGIGYYKPDGTIISYNHLAAKNMNGVPEDFAGKSIYEIFPAHEADFYLERIRKACLSDKSDVYEDKISLPGGDKCFLSTFTQIKDINNNISGIQIISQDITELKAAETELREKETQYRNLANAGLALIWTSGKDKLCNYFNEPWLKFTGRTLEQELGEGWAEGVHPEDIGYCLKIYTTAFEKQKEFEMEYRLRHASGEYRWILDIGTPNYDRNKNFIGYIGYCFDISERKENEQRIKASEARYRSFIEVTDQLGWVTNANGEVEQDIPIWRRFTGMSLEEVIGIGWIKSLHPEDRENTIKVWNDAVKGQLPYETEYRIRRYDGVYRNFLARGIPVFAEEDTICEWVGTCIDITNIKEAERALIESETALRTLVDGLPDIVLRFDRNGRHLFASENIFAVTDIKAEQFIGRTHRELGFSEEQSQFWENSLRQVFDSGISSETEFSFESRKGTIIYNWRLIPEKDENGKTVSVLSISRDITKNRRTEQNYKILFNEMLDGFALHEIICDDNGIPVNYRFLNINPAFERMTGLIAAEIVGKTVLEALPGIEASWIETYGKVALTGQPMYFENYSADLNKYFEVVAFRPAPGQFACIFSDVSERKQAEISLKESEEKYSRLINGSPYITHIFDTKRGALFWSKQIESIMGYRLEDLHNDPFLWFNNFIQEDRQKVSSILNQLKPGEETEFEFRAIDIYGNLHWFHDKIFNVMKSTDSIIIEGIAHDITLRKNAEDKNRKLEEQLRKSQKLETIGTLAGGVAHDFNNILTPILGYAQLALMNLDDKTALKEFIDIMINSAYRAKDLVKQILTFARQIDEEKKELDLASLLKEAIKFLRPSIPSTIEIKQNITRELVIILADPSQIHQVIMNICTNAFQAMENRVGTLSIDLAVCLISDDERIIYHDLAAGKYARLSIKDTGSGMDKTTLEKIFEPFFTTKEVGKGTGLGLSVVHGIVKAHQGDIHVYSDPGVGTKFDVYLPALEIAAKDYDRTEKPLLGGNERIIIVDDEPSITSMTSTILTKKGYRITAFNESEIALLYIKDNYINIDLVITDLTMPKMTGVDLIEAIRIAGIDLPVILMTGYNREISPEDKTLYGINNVINKPVSISELTVEIRKIFDQKSENPG